MILAKLPDENKDGWAQLEQDMTKESQKKDTKPDGLNRDSSESPEKKDFQLGGSQYSEMNQTPFGNVIAHMEKEQ